MEQNFSATVLNSRLPYLFGNEIEYFHELAENLPENSVIVCLGTGPGMMLMALLEQTNKQFDVFSVDIGDSFTARTHVGLVIKNRNSMPMFITNDSAEEAKKWGDNEVDVLLVDADHSEAGVLRDIKAWWKKVKYNGTIFFHDYVKLEADNGVKEAIEVSITDEWELIGQPGISAVYKKVK